MKLYLYGTEIAYVPFMIKLWKTISNIGVTNNLTLSQQNQVILLNRVVAIFSVAIWVKFILDFLDKDYIGIGIIFTMGTLFSTTFLLNHLQKIKLARIYFISVFLFVITVVNMFVGKALGAEFSYFSIIVMVFIFFGDKLSRMIFGFITILCYVISQIYFQNFESPLSSILTGSSYHFMFFANLICTTLSTLTFVKENKRFSQQSVQLLKSAEEQNQKLAETQKEFEKQNIKLEAVNTELEKFAYIASHDLKTPLRNISNFLSLITRKLQKEKQDDLLEYINQASKSAKQMHYLIEDILEFSRLDGENFSTSEVNLNDLLPKVQENIKEFIEEKNAIVQIGKLPIIQGQQSQLILLFQNFIENAIKYNVNEKPLVRISCETNEQHHMIKIKDNGIGIEEEYFDKIFEMFTRLHNQQEFQGSGIGLAICQKIAHYHGGVIQMESSIGNGTTFTIVFPKENAIPSFKLDETLVNSTAFELN